MKLLKIVILVIVEAAPAAEKTGVSGIIARKFSDIAKQSRAISIKRVCRADLRRGDWAGALAS